MEHPDSASRAVAAAVRAALTDASLTRRQAAEQTGIPLTTLTRRLTGTSPFTVTELHQIARVTGVTVSSLVTHTEEGAA